MISFLNNLSNQNARIIIVISALILCNFVLMGRIVEIALGHAPDIYYSARSTEKLYKRAEIVDVKGRVIATNLKVASLYANPQQIADPKDVAHKLNKIFPRHSYDFFLKKLTAKNQFQWIARHITPKKQKEINELGIVGLITIDEIKRIYPNQNNLSHIVGNVDLDNKGISGLEKEFDSFLRYSDANSAKLQLTFDTRVQEIVRTVLKKHISLQDALGGAAIVMDPHTGEVIAMVSAPDFDPNKLADATDDERFNRLATGLYEPGSTMKALSVAMGIDSGRVNTNGIYNVSQPLKFGRYKVRDLYHKRNELSVPEILMYSSNIGVVKINDEVGTNIQKNYLKSFGLFDKLAIEIAEKSAPMHPKVSSKWSSVSSATISYGHGIAVSPLHMASAYTAIVNGGYYVTPKFVKNISGSTPPPKRILKKETSDTMRKLLRKVAKSGASRKAEVKGYLVGGKTGSAEKNENGKYRKDANVSSFCGAFPMDNPKYLIYVMLDEAKKNDYNRGYTTAGQIAAPLARDIIENIVGTLNLPPQPDMWEIDEDLNA